AQQRDGFRLGIGHLSESYAPAHIGTVTREESSNGFATIAPAPHGAAPPAVDPGRGPRVPQGRSVSRPGRAERDPDGDGIHIYLSPHRSAGFRQRDHRVHAGGALSRVKGPQVLSLVVSR